MYSFYLNLKVNNLYFNIPVECTNPTRLPHPKSVFEITGKFYYHNQHRAQHLPYAKLLHTTCDFFLQMSVLERLEKVNFSQDQHFRPTFKNMHLVLGLFFNNWWWKPNIVSVLTFTMLEQICLGIFRHFLCPNFRT